MLTFAELYREDLCRLQVIKNKIKKNGCHWYQNIETPSRLPQNCVAGRERGDKCGVEQQGQWQALVIGIKDGGRVADNKTTLQSFEAGALITLLYIEKKQFRGTKLLAKNYRYLLY